MKFFLDEGAPRQIGEELIANGFEVIFFSDGHYPELLTMSSRILPC